MAENTTENSFADRETERVQRERQEDEVQEKKIKKDVEKRIPAILKDIEDQRSEYMGDPYHIRNMNLILLSLIWVKCRKGNKKDFVDALLREEGTSYSKRALNDICSGNIYSTYAMNKDCYNKISTTLDISGDYMSGKKLFSVDAGKKQFSETLFRYYYFLIDKHSNNVVDDKEMSTALINLYEAKLIYKGIHSVGEEANSSNKYCYNNEHYKISDADVKRLKGCTELWADGQFCNLQDSYNEIHMDDKIYDGLKRALYYIKYLESKRQNISYPEKMIQGLVSINNADFWDALDIILNKACKDNIEEKIIKLKQWETVWEKQLNLFRSKRYIYEAQNEKSAE